MKKWSIVLYDPKDNIYTFDICEHVTFQEAAREAYLLRKSKGLDIQILSVSNVENSHYNENKNLK